MVCNSLDQVKEALEEAGFVLLIVESDPTSIQNSTVSDRKSVIFLAALKKIRMTLIFQNPQFFRYIIIVIVPLLT